MSQATEAAAIRAAIDAQFTIARTLDLADAKNTGTDHILVFVSRRYVDDKHASGEVTIPGGRVVTRYVALKESNVSVMRERTAAALEDRIISGLGPFTFESGDDIDTDDKWFVSEDVWTY